MIKARSALDTYLKEPKMEAWSLNRKLLTGFLRKKVADRFKGDPLVETQELSSGEFRIRVSHIDTRVGPRYFRIKIIEEK